jgi:hypothetical protein
MRSKRLSDDDILRLERLVALKNQGALSEAEFEAQKANIIASAGSETAIEPSSYARSAAGSDRRAVSLGGLTFDPAYWLKTKPLRIAAGTIVFIALAAGLQILLRPAQVDTAPSLPKAQPVQPPRPIAEGAPRLKVAAKPTIDTASEMRAAGWDETSDHGLDCIMERRGERQNGLNYIFIYSGDVRRTYELSFTSPVYRNDSNRSLTAESNPEFELAVIVDGVRVPATLQNHAANYWEVEIPLSSRNRSRIARATSIALQLGPEVIAREAIRPNPTSISTIERCLAP